MQDLELRRQTSDFFYKSVHAEDSCFLLKVSDDRVIRSFRLFILSSNSTLSSIPALVHDWRALVQCRSWWWSFGEFYTYGICDSFHDDVTHWQLALICARVSGPRADTIRSAIPCHLMTNSTAGPQSEPYDAPGAAIFITSVVLVYGLGVVVIFLLGLTRRRRRDAHNDDQVRSSALCVLHGDVWFKSETYLAILMAITTVIRFSLTKKINFIDFVNAYKQFHVWFSVITS